MPKPSIPGDIATYALFGTGGLLIGSIAGKASGSFSIFRGVSQDPESKERIFTALRRLRADILRKDADALYKKEDVVNLLKDGTVEGSLHPDGSSVGENDEKS